MAALPEKRPGGATKPPIGLLLSIGEPKPEGRPGRPIDWIRPKEGELAQFAAAATKYHEVYGEQPRQLDDLFFLSNNIGDILDIRLMAWGSSGPRIVGDTNFATLPRDEWEQRAFAFDDDITYFPLSPEEVKSDLRATWNGEPVRGTLTGPDDARIDRLKIGVECTLTFCLPKVMGFGTVAKITTKGRRSTRNLVSSLIDQSTFFQGQLVGIPFRLTVRPTKGRHFDKTTRKYMATTFYELVLDTPFTVQEAIEAIKERRGILGAPATADIRQLESRVVEQMLELPAGDDVATQQLRDEPAPTPGDARLNRLARLEDQAGADAAHALLIGVFGVESASDLSDDEAERYEAMLTRNVESAEEAEAELVDEDETAGESAFERMAREAQERGPGDDAP